MTRIEAIMLIVDEMYSEKDTLKTTIGIDCIAILHANGQDWGRARDFGDVLYDHNGPQIVAKDSRYNADLYVFITGKTARATIGNCL